MNFDLKETQSVLKRTPGVLDALLSDLSGFWIDKREKPGGWSAKEVVAHLIHGEIEDWIPRTKIILFEEDKHFPPFDPSGLDIAGKSMEELLLEFRKLRLENLKELERFNLSKEDLSKKGIHPEFGEVTLKQHLSTWTIHDLNHINQICRVMSKKYVEDIGPWYKYIRVARD